MTSHSLTSDVSGIEHPFEEGSFIGQKRCPSQPWLRSQSCDSCCVISLPPSVFVQCHVEVKDLKPDTCRTSTLPPVLSNLCESLNSPRHKSWRWRTGNGHRYCPSSTTGATACLPGAAPLDILPNHRVCLLFCLSILINCKINIFPGIYPSLLNTLNCYLDQENWILQASLHTILLTSRIYRLVRIAKTVVVDS